MATTTDRCTVPPPGWECSRPEGHPPPCAATETSGRSSSAGAAPPSRLHVAAIPLDERDAWPPEAST